MTASGRGANFGFPPLAEQRSELRAIQRGVAKEFVHVVIGPGEAA